MKHARLFVGLLALGAVLAFAGCKKDEPVADGSGSTSEPETSITFKVREAGELVEGVLVGVAPNQTDRDNGIFLYSGTTSGTGRVKFERLEALRYYYSASLATGSGTAVRSGSIELELEDKVTREIDF